ncbi:hypothetical protein EVAR_61999_1 [Eumeta japonica]|uniref:Uncharacterized protein n=1 Tax=Eumeta variegata TaxID=151549 RepID=A0A4C1YI75_EUMVA|nr:hypothetical protein EVAR_61999_1 [Eumeta japonica]
MRVMEGSARVALKNIPGRPNRWHIKKGPNFKHPKPTSLEEKIDGCQRAECIHYETIGRSGRKRLRAGQLARKKSAHTARRRPSGPLISRGAARRTNRSGPPSPRRRRARPAAAHPRTRPRLCVTSKISKTIVARVLDADAVAASRIGLPPVTVRPFEVARSDRKRSNRDAYRR